MEQAKKFAFDVGWVFTSSIVTLVFSFSLRIVLARWLGAADLGLYQMVITIQGIATLFATFGIGVALTKYVAEYKDDKDKLFQTVSSGFISSVIFGVVTGILVYTLSGTLASVFDMPELARLLKIVAFVFPLTSLLEASLQLFIGLRKMKTYAYLIILRSFLMILFIVTFVWLGFGVEGAVLGIALSIMAGCILGLYTSRSFLHLNLPGFFHNTKKLVSFGSQVAGINALGLVTVQADIILIGYFLTAKDVGQYSIAVTLSNLFFLLPYAIQKITYPATSEYWSKNNHQALQKMSDKSTKYSTCILLVLGLGVGFFAREIIITMFGTEFLYAALPLWILLIARVIRGGLIMPMGGAFSGIGRPDIAFKLGVLSSGINIALNILLIPHLGITGAAIATTISLLVHTVTFLALMPKILGVRIDIRWFSAAIGTACVAVGLFLAGIKLINPYIVGGIILGSYSILIFKLFLTKEDRDMLRSLVYSLVSRR